MWPLAGHVTFTLSWGSTWCTVASTFWSCFFIFSARPALMKLNKQRIEKIMPGMPYSMTLMFVLDLPGVTSRTPALLTALTGRQVQWGRACLNINVLQRHKNQRSHMKVLFARTWHFSSWKNLSIFDELCIFYVTWGSSNFLFDISFWGAIFNSIKGS